MELEVYTQVKDTVQALLSIDLEHYKDEQMRRRLDSWLSRSGTGTWEMYFDRVKNDSVERRRFRDYLTINVTEFFRDFERWTYLKEHVIPVLLNNLKANHRSMPGLRVWSAGCSTGAEIYSLAMLLNDLSPGISHYLLATDLDLGALDKAKNGGPYAAEEVRNLTDRQRKAYLKNDNPPFFLNGNLASKITFREHDLLKSNYEDNFDLIICRNVVIYFTSNTKQYLYEKFYRSLRTGGILFVGGTEIIPRPQDLGLKSYGFSFYIKQ